MAKVPASRQSAKRNVAKKTPPGIQKPKQAGARKRKLPVRLPLEPTISGLREQLAEAAVTVKQLTDRHKGEIAYLQGMVFRLTADQSPWVRQNNQIRQCVERNKNLANRPGCKALMLELNKILGY